MNFGIQRAGFSLTRPLSNESENSDGDQAYRQLRTTVHALKILVAGLALCHLIYISDKSFS
jgi:hypothetical protein